jgi:hypothetical protein
MKKLPQINYYPISEITESIGYPIDNISKAIIDQLDKGNIYSIIDAFYQNTQIYLSGMPFISVKGISKILRTGNSRAERALIYQGIPNYLPKAEIIKINGEDYISGNQLIAIIDYRISGKLGKTKEYLNISRKIYYHIVESSYTRDIKDMFIEEINQYRPRLKKERIKKYNIRKCEFTGKIFNSHKKVQFAHIDSVVYRPDKALDIDNGVIILIEIHKDMTNEGINTYEETYKYCEKKGYNLDWAS